MLSSHSWRVAVRRQVRAKFRTGEDETLARRGPFPADSE